MLYLLNVSGRTFPISSKLFPTLPCEPVIQVIPPPSPLSSPLSPPLPPPPKKRKAGLILSEHEYHDEVLPRAELDYDAVQTSPPTIALSAIHGTAFHRGLGSPILASPTTPINVHQIAEYASLAYTKSNVVIVASGATTEELAPQIQEFWGDMPAGKPLPTPTVKFHGGETRIAHKTANHNVYAIAFPGSALYGPKSSPEQIVLAHHLGGFPRLKWANGHSAFAKVSAGLEGKVNLFATNIGYSDAGLFCIMAVGGPFNVAEGIARALRTLRDIAKGTTTIKADELKRAIASARYITYATSEARLSGLEPIGQSVLDLGKVPDTDSVVASYEKVTPDKLKQVFQSPVLGVLVTTSRLLQRCCNLLRQSRLLVNFICSLIMMSSRLCMKIRRLSQTLV